MSWFAAVVLAAAGVAYDAPLDPAMSTAAAPVAAPSTAVPASPSPSPTPSRPAVRSSLHLTLLGDSLTAGEGSTDNRGYVPALELLLADSGVHARITNRGRHGWTIRIVHDHAAGWLRQDNPDVVLLLVGANDALFPPAGQPGRYAALVDTILAAAPRAKLVVAKMQLVADPTRAARQRLLNDWLPTLPATHPGRVFLADMSVIPNALTLDGVHPGDAGYAAMAAQWHHTLTRCCI